MKTLAIVGSGDLGRQIAHHALSDRIYNRIVFFDDFCNENEIDGIPILGKTDQIELSYIEKKFDELIIGIGYKHLKKKKELFEKFSKLVPIGNVIHSSCWIDSTAVIEQGCVLYPGCVIDANVIIKANTILNISSTVCHDSTIDSHCFLSPRVAIAGFVKIYEQCFLGINTTIIDNIFIVENTFLGAGSLVNRSIEKSGLYAGNPVKFIR